MRKIHLLKNSQLMRIFHSSDLSVSVKSFNNTLRPDRKCNAMSCQSWLKDNNNSNNNDTTTNNNNRKKLLTDVCQ